MESDTLPIRGLRLGHKKPCRECPFRIKSPAGYLGGNTPEQYADTVQANVIPSCHMHVGKFCAGALALAENSCIAQRHPAGAGEAGEEVGRRSDCFKNVHAFYEHHAGKPYVHPLLRDRD